MTEKGIEGQEIITVGNQGLAEMTDDIIASAERRVAQIDKIIILSLKRTNANDWVDQNGKPYLVCSGAEKIARLFGVSWKIVKSEKIMTNDEKGQFYFYQVTGVFSLPNKIDMVEAVGTCSSKDSFFAKVKGELKPISEVDETNIMKSAYSNCVVNGLTRLLGIRNLTWEQVEQGGVKKSDAASVRYASGGAGGGLVSEAQRKRMWAIMLANKVDKEDVKKYLMTNYSYTEGKSENIKKEDYEKICGWLENGGK